ILLEVVRNDKDGLLKMTDLTLEMMRYIRHHPNLTVVELYNHMLFVDEMGHQGIRKPGEFRDIIVAGFMKRNFDLDVSQSAKFNVVTDLGELTNQSLGSRYNPVPLNLAASDTKAFSLKLNVVDGTKNKFKYPVTVKATYNGSPLQGNV